MENVKKFYEFLKNDPAAGQELQDKFQKIKKIRCKCRNDSTY